ncbi:MAG: N-acetylneuraminate synthase [Clostridium sp.]|uniref:N-acetylneuraminate synthase n=1 Tax=Clostridium sp. DSM 8431 TaxID=1761781 RepID=UPI0008E11E10|nr:N-acetylneuraminate synthase [Clostridium sp. DSM 8431]MCR4943546.1 N-acetylneuraminate synthase [Clostridium sp.]SFU65838.1 N-acetylneuraminate synthase [Clostridium sp. DSM 8431]
MDKVKIGNKYIGKNEKVYIVAELGVNHNGDMNIVKELIDKASEAGVDAIKFQKFKTESLVTKDSPKAKYQEVTTDASESQFDMLKRLELNEENLKELYAYAKSKNIEAFATPFDDASVDFLYDLGIKAYKVGSGDITNIPMLKRIAKTGLPIILSTGMSTLGEIEEALEAIRSQGNDDVVLMHCTSNYPSDENDVNLKAMNTMMQAFQLPTGYSDHTMGTAVSVAAVARGAVIIEKHFTLDRSMPGPDHMSSLEPEELKQLVQQIRAVEKALGSPIKKPNKSEYEVKNVAQKSIVSACDIKKGEIISEEMLTCKRPSSGIKPKYFELVVGRVAKKDIKSDTIINIDMI